MDKIKLCFFFLRKLSIYFYITSWIKIRRAIFNRAYVFFSNTALYFEKHYSPNIVFRWALFDVRTIRRDSGPRIKVRAPEVFLYQLESRHITLTVLVRRKTLFAKNKHHFYALILYDPCQSDFFKLVTKLERWGHPCPIDTCLVLYFFVLNMFMLFLQFLCWCCW